MTREGVRLLAATGLERDGILVAFTGRGHGAGAGAFSGMNLSFDVGDEFRRVARNRAALALALGVPPGGMAFPRQVHGATVRLVGPMEAGRGASDFESALPRADGLVTRLAGVAIGVLTADCVPVVLAAPGSRAVAVAHAGWRGALAGTAAVAFRNLAREAGCAPGDVTAFIGPHIRPCCFETGEEVSNLFETRFRGAGIRAGNGNVDLGRACAAQLLEAGVEAGRIQMVDRCTSCSGEFFSYRASGGSCGRQGGFAVIREA